MPISNLTLGVVVPAYNEERLIGVTIATMPDYVDSIFVIDDASTDATLERIADIDDPRVVVIRHHKNTGVGGAVLDGHRAALAAGCDVAVVMAGDAQMPPEYLGDLLQPIVDDQADFTKGNRFANPQALAAMPRLRRWGSIVLSMCTKLASGYWHLSDSQNGYTAVHRRVLSRLPLDEINQGYPFENSMLIHLNIAGARAIDVPIPARYGEEVSSMRISFAGPAILWELCRGYWVRIWRKYVLHRPSPIAPLAFTGAVCILVGFLVGVFATYHSIGEDAASAGTVLLAGGAAVIGVQCVIGALVLDYLHDRRLP